GRQLHRGPPIRPHRLPSHRDASGPAAQGADRRRHRARTRRALRRHPDGLCQLRTQPGLGMHLGPHGRHPGRRAGHRPPARARPRPIAFGGGQGGAVPSTRERAYRRAMESRGLTPIVRPAGYFEHDGYAAAEELLALPSPPTAIVSINDISAIGVLAAADDAGVAVPDELAVVGVDNISLSALKRISLTSVHPQTRAIGRLSAGAVCDMLADPEEPAKQHLITPQLVIRRSTVRDETSGRP